MCKFFINSCQIFLCSNFILYISKKRQKNFMKLTGLNFNYYNVQRINVKPSFKAAITLSPVKLIPSEMWLAELAEPARKSEKLQRAFLFSIEDECTAHHCIAITEEGALNILKPIFEAIKDASITVRISAIDALAYSQIEEKSCARYDGILNRIISAFERALSDVEPVREAAKDAIERMHVENKVNFEQKEKVFEELRFNPTGNWMIYIKDAVKKYKTSKIRLLSSISDEIERKNPKNEQVEIVKLFKPLFGAAIDENFIIRKYAAEILGNLALKKPEIMKIQQVNDQIMSTLEQGLSDVDSEKFIEVYGKAGNACNFIERWQADDLDVKSASVGAYGKAGAAKIYSQTINSKELEEIIDNLTSFLFEKDGCHVRRHYSAIGLKHMAMALNEVSSPRQVDRQRTYKIITALEALSKDEEAFKHMNYPGLYKQEVESSLNLWQKYSQKV